jgi:hypothetical protein
MVIVLKMACISITTLNPILNNHHELGKVINIKYLEVQKYFLRNLKLYPKG